MDKREKLLLLTWLLLMSCQKMITVKPQFSNLVCSGRLFKKLFVWNWFSFVCCLTDMWLIIQTSAWKGCWVEKQSFIWQPRQFFCELLGGEPNSSGWKMFENKGLTVRRSGIEIFVPSINNLATCLLWYMSVV